MASEKIHPLNLNALIAHHTPTFTSRNGISWINMISLLFLRALVPTEMKPSFPAKKNERGIYISIKHLINVPVPKIPSCFTISRSASYSL